MYRNLCENDSEPDIEIGESRKVVLRYPGTVMLYVNIPVHTH